MNDRRRHEGFGFAWWIHDDDLARLRSPVPEQAVWLLDEVRFWRKKRTELVSAVRVLADIVADAGGGIAAELVRSFAARFATGEEIYQKAEPDAAPAWSAADQRLIDAIAEAAAQGCMDEAVRMHGQHTSIGNRYAAAAKAAVMTKLEELRSVSPDPKPQWARGDER